MARRLPLCAVCGKSLEQFKDWTKGGKVTKQADYGDVHHGGGGALVEGNEPTAPPPPEPMPFPEDEVTDLQKQLAERGHAYTTRVDQERGKYKVGQTYQAPWGPVTVQDVQSFDKLEDHPFLGELKDAWKQQITGPYDHVKFAAADVDYCTVCKEPWSGQAA